MSQSVNTAQHDAVLSALMDALLSHTHTQPFSPFPPTSNDFYNTAAFSTPSNFIASSTLGLNDTSGPFFNTGSSVPPPPLFTSTTSTVPGALSSMALEVAGSAGGVGVEGEGGGGCGGVAEAWLQEMFPHLSAAQRSRLARGEGTLSSALPREDEAGDPADATDSCALHQVTRRSGDQQAPPPRENGGGEVPNPAFHNTPMPSSSVRKFDAAKKVAVKGPALCLGGDSESLFDAGTCKTRNVWQSHLQGSTCSGQKNGNEKKTNQKHKKRTVDHHQGLAPSVEDVEEICLDETEVGREGVGEDAEDFSESEDDEDDEAWLKAVVQRPQTLQQNTTTTTTTTPVTTKTSDDFVDDGKMNKVERENEKTNNGCRTSHRYNHKGNHSRAASTRLSDRNVSALLPCALSKPPFVSGVGGGATFQDPTVGSSQSLLFTHNGEGSAVTTSETSMLPPKPTPKFNTFAFMTEMESSSIGNQTRVDRLHPTQGGDVVGAPTMPSHNTGGVGPHTQSSNALIPPVPTVERTEDSADEDADDDDDDDDAELVSALPDNDAPLAATKKETEKSREGDSQASREHVFLSAIVHEVSDEVTPMTLDPFFDYDANIMGTTPKPGWSSLHE